MLTWHTYAMRFLSLHNRALNDDVATAVVVDTALGFQTHKMDVKFREPPLNVHAVRKVLRKLYSDGDVKDACDELVRLPYVRAILADRRSAERKVLLACCWRGARSAWRVSHSFSALRRL